MDSLKALESENENRDVNLRNSMENNDQLCFLQDQVRRLTAVVGEYQMKYPSINNKDIMDMDNAPSLAPWMTDTAMASPLFVEYDNNIKALKNQIKYYKEQFNSLQEKSREIVQENDRLHQELRRTVENQLDVLQQTDGLSNHTQTQLDQLQHKLKVLSDEKIRVDSLYQNVVKENNLSQSDLKAKVQIISSLTTENAQLQDDIKNARLFAENLQKTNQKLKIEHEKFLKAAQVQDSELDELKTQVRKLNVELKTCKSLNAELQSRNLKLKDHFKCLDKSKANDAISEKSAEGTIRKLQAELMELDSRVISYSKELEKLRLEKMDMEEQISALQRKNAQVEENEYQAILRVRDSVQLVENALLEREQAVVKEQQKSQEVLRLQEAINTLLRESEEKANNAVVATKAKTNKQLEQLMEDLHFHEIEAAEKQVAYEKLQREKTSLQNELEKIYQEGPIEVTKAGLSIDELQKKLSKVELNRDECLLQIDILQMTLRQYKSRLENDKTAYMNQLNELRKQTKTIKEDFDEVSESRMKILNEVNILKKELNSKKEDNAVRDTNCASQVASLKQKLEIQQKDYESRLLASENMNKDAMNELRDMLATQQKSANKWREESRILCQKLEKTINKLTCENSALKRKNEELKHIHNQGQSKIEELQKECSTNQITIDKLKTLYSTAEEQVECTSEQIQLHVSREKQLQKENRSLNKEIDKLKLEISRPKRLHTIEQQWDSYLEGYGKDMS